MQPSLGSYQRCRRLPSTAPRPPQLGRVLLFSLGRARIDGLKQFLLAPPWSPYAATPMKAVIIPRDRPRSITTGTKGSRRRVESSVKMKKPPTCERLFQELN